MARNIIFLDIDGVLNNEATFVLTPHKYMEPACVEFLKGALELIPDCSIVITSTWRRSGELQEFFNFVSYRNCSEIFEPLKQYLHEDFAVRNLRGKIRGEEVAEWLLRHPEVEKYVCIDDGTQYLPDQPLLRIDRLHGFWLDDKLTLLDYFRSLDVITNYPAIINTLSRKVLLQKKLFIKKYISN